MIEQLNFFLNALCDVIIIITLAICGRAWNKQYKLLENRVSKLEVHDFCVSIIESRIEQLEDLTKYMEHDLYNKEVKK